MDLCKFIITILFTHIFLNAVNAAENRSPHKDVVIVGGGLAGMAAARRLLREPNINVKVLEAQKKRYGGQIWTYREGLKGVKGVDVELGAMFLNTQDKNNRLLKLAEEFELKLANAGNLQLYFIDDAGNLTTYSGDTATQLYTQAFKIAMKALQDIKKQNIDRPVRDLFLDAVDSIYKSENKSYTEQSSVARIIMSLPTAVLHNFSSLLYEIEHDFGWDRVIVDGMDAFIDRIVAGSGTQSPIKIELNKIVRNIEVDNKRNKVLIRTVDRKQVIADAVVVAVPVGVLRKKDLIFDPPLPVAWYKAMRNIGIGYSMKVIVGFDMAFWPKEIGTFNVFSDLASDGFLQTWTNAYRLSGNPFLIGNIFGPEALVWEKRPDSELKELVVLVLSEMFGASTVNAHKITTFIHSNWSTDELTLGSLSYPSVGSSPDLWNNVQEPVCPYIYFAGAYTETMSHVDSLHGAYNSGIRAAEQIIQGVCKNLKPQTSKPSKSDTTSGKTDAKYSKPDAKSKSNVKSPKQKQKKDEL